MNSNNMYVYYLYKRFDINYVHNITQLK